MYEKLNLFKVTDYADFQCASGAELFISPLSVILFKKCIRNCPNVITFPIKVLLPRRKNFYPLFSTGIYNNISVAEHFGVIRQVIRRYIFLTYPLMQ